jgi:hypothetical protein
MARFPTPAPSGSAVADRSDRASGAGLGRLLGDLWGAAAPSHGEVHGVRLWTSAWDAKDRALALRVRAATAADPLFR